MSYRDKTNNDGETWLKQDSHLQKDIYKPKKIGENRVQRQVKGLIQLTTTKQKKYIWQMM